MVKEQIERKLNFKSSVVTSLEYLRMREVTPTPYGGM